ncbi:MAG: hypothetical protein GX088_04235 [Clostridia bacterium]|nr:hypothetical protein [Clostridia bacterium]
MADKIRDEIKKKAKEYIADEFQESSGKNPDDFDVKKQNINRKNIKKGK